jgi:3-oxoacyl-[acyl-carrier-protein] synthase II
MGLTISKRKFEEKSVRKRVVITGIGTVCPVGNDTATAWRNILAGVSGVKPVTLFDPSQFKTKIVAEVKDFDAKALLGRQAARRYDRVSQLSLVATQEAIEHAGLVINDQNRDRVGVLIGSGIGGINTLYENILVYLERGPSRVSPFTVPMMLPDSPSGLVAIEYGARGPNMAIVTACATGTNSIGEAAEMIRRGAADVMLAGSSESAINPITFAGMGIMGAISTRNDEPERASRPFDAERDGFIIGEGAGTVVLESLEFAQARGAKILAEVTGYGVTNDAFHISAPSENGEGSALCMQLALEDGGFSPDDINYINAHGTSTMLNDKNETIAIKTIFGKQAYKTPISSTKSMTGHLMGAAGSVEAVFCVKIFETDILPPTINYENPDPECDLDYIPNQARAAHVDHIMSNSFGFGGHNATLIFSRYSE